MIGLISGLCTDFQDIGDSGANLSFEDARDWKIGLSRGVPIGRNGTI